jgi:hypothetical protein
VETFENRLEAFADGRDSASARYVLGRNSVEGGKMPVAVYERPRRHQFELRYLYRPKSRPEQKWLSRIGQFTLSMVHLCGFAYVLLLAVAIGSRGHAYEPPAKPLANYHQVADETIPIRLSDGWETVVVENPSR